MVIRSLCDRLVIIRIISGYIQIYYYYEYEEKHYENIRCVIKFIVWAAAGKVDINSVYGYKLVETTAQAYGSVTLSASSLPVGVYVVNAANVLAKQLKG